MKKMKMMALAAAMVSAMGLSSCLDGGEYDPTWTIMDFVKVRNLMGYTTFESQFGYQYVPSSQELAKNFDSSLPFALVSIKYDPSIPATADKQVNVDLLGGYSIQEGDGVIEANPQIEDANAPIVSVIPADNSWGVGFYKLDDLFFPIMFYTINSQDSDELEEELAKHQFTFYYDVSEFTNTAMKLHLRHKVDDIDDEEMNKKRTVQKFSYTHFNFSEPLSKYRATYNNENPDKIVIEYEENQTDVEYGSSTPRVNAFEIDYKTIVDNYNKVLETNNGNNTTVE